jgi:predicted nuclease with TOPRIM domain
MTPDEFVKAFKVAVKDTEVKKSIGEIVSDRLNAEISSLRSELQEKNARIDALEKKLLSLESQTEGLEQYSRRNNIRVSNIPEQSNENITSTTLSILNDNLKLDPPICEQDIDRIHRTGKVTENPSKPRSVLIKFVSYATKNRIMNNRALLKSDRHIEEALFASDDLTSLRSKAMYDLRCMKRNKIIQETWTRDGNVFIKDNHQNVKCGKTLLEIQELIHQLR